ncbi:MAG: HPF/RaiA family ribosome-associated protein [Candidatus Cybelea sp.]
MAFPVRISYRGVEATEQLDRLIHSEAAKLEKFFDGIVSCRVLVEHQDGHQHTGSAPHVRLNIVVPGNDLAVDAEPTVREAFRAAKRRIQEYARRKSGGPHHRSSIR